MVTADRWDHRKTGTSCSHRVTPALCVLPQRQEKECAGWTVQSKRSGHKAREGRDTHTRSQSCTHSLQTITADEIQVQAVERVFLYEFMELCNMQVIPHRSSGAFKYKTMFVNKTYLQMSWFRNPVCRSFLQPEVSSVCLSWKARYVPLSKGIKLIFSPEEICVHRDFYTRQILGL